MSLPVLSVCPGTGKEVSIYFLMPYGLFQDVGFF